MKSLFLIWKQIMHKEPPNNKALPINLTNNKLFSFLLSIKEINIYNKTNY